MSGDLETKKKQAYKVLQAIARLTDNEKYFVYYDRSSEVAAASTLKESEIALPASTERSVGCYHIMEENMKSFRMILEDAGIGVTVLSKINKSESKVPGMIGLVIDIEKDGDKLQKLLKKVAAARVSDTVDTLVNTLGTGELAIEAVGEALGAGAQSARKAELPETALRRAMQAGPAAERQ